MTLFALVRSGAMASLTQRPALVLAISTLAGILYRYTGLPMSDAGVVKLIAEACLALLVFSAALHFRISRLHLNSPAALRLAVIAGPFFMVIVALSVFVLSPSVTVWSALVIGAALMLNGASLERRVFRESSISKRIKASITLESAAALVVGLPIAVMIETAAMTPHLTSGDIVETGIFRTAIGFAIGGAIGLLGGRGYKWLVNRKSPLAKPGVTITAGLLAFCLASLLGGSAIIAVCAAGLMWSEESSLKRSERFVLHSGYEQIAKPLAFVLFGFVLGPRLLQADALVILFALFAVTLLRIVPRLIALKSLKLATEEEHFLAWFGGAPGAASALFLLCLIDSPALADQEIVMTIGATCVWTGVFITRASSRSLASFFIQRAAAARRKRYYA
ncbi:cation:proton antiporter [Parvularcula sp. IMCC14364]|uniref:cation:proton antiporter domain-containing protein n=1 Tax=Parvularcula sp. IMCC14364 TaxID=3067902 RepID=UPI002741A0DF|nr:cation:proton antiporter [Parvularcula sp. IMCC14364]